MTEEDEFKYAHATQERTSKQKEELVISSFEAEFIDITSRQNTQPNDKPQSIHLTPKNFKEILTSENKWEAPVKPVLLMTGGLPNSGKSEAIRQLLHLSDMPVNKGFTHHDVISVEERLLKPEDPHMTHHFGFLAGIRTNFNDEQRQVEKFTDDELSASLADECIPHYLSLKHSWERLKEKSPIESMFHSRSLKRGAGLVKIWDIAFDSFSLQFLRCFSGHFYNSYMWLFTDVERDLRRLHTPLSKNDTTQVMRRSRIQNLLNPSKLSSKLNDKRKSTVCTVFAKYDSNVKLEEKIDKLQRECNSATPQLKCSELINEKIIPISFNDESASKLFRHQLRQELQMSFSKAPQGIPLSHMFLRGSLELESSVFMRREELKKKAKLCEIDNESFDEFCKSFTSFGSIIDVSLVSDSDIIIVKPDEFLSKLDQAFNIQDDEVSLSGVLTNEKALAFFGEEYPLFLNVLEAVGLIVSTEHGYYTPTLVKKDEVIKFDPEAVQMIRSSRYPPINMEVALTKHLLQSIPNSKLELTGKKNSTVISSPIGKVTITYHGEAIEFIMPHNHQEIIRKVIGACKEISHQLQKRSGEGKFHFAILCKKHTNYLAGYDYYRKRHVLENDIIDDCKHCNLTENTNVTTWNRLICEAIIDDENLKLNGGLTIQESSRLIDEISTYDAFNVHLFIRALNSNRALPVDKTKWKWILMEIFVLWINQVHKESTKKEMAVILIELDSKCDKDIGTKPRFKKLARELDLQTLTLKQIEQLHS